MEPWSLCLALCLALCVTIRMKPVDDIANTPSIGEPLPPLSMTERLMEIARASVLEELASGIAHEINQPLGAIAAFAQAGERMLDRPQPMVVEALDVLRQIASQAIDAGDGIRRIRKLVNRDTPNMTTCAIDDLLFELLPVLDAAAQRLGGTLNIEVQPNLPRTVVDRLRIQHALYTLVQNAFEASGSAPTVTIRITGNRYAVEVSVLDCGAGVPEHAREQIFRPFFTTKRSGTGLGLASTRAIMEAHEGSIGFEDIGAGGTRFWFRLPAATEPAIDTSTQDART